MIRELNPIFYRFLGRCCPALRVLLLTILCGGTQPAFAQSTLVEFTGDGTVSFTVPGCNINTTKPSDTNVDIVLPGVSTDQLVSNGGTVSGWITYTGHLYVWSSSSCVLQYAESTDFSTTVTLSVGAGGAGTLTFNGETYSVQMSASGMTGSYTVSGCGDAGDNCTYSLPLTGGTKYSPVVISTGATLPDAAPNVYYLMNLQASGGTPPYTWAQDTGTMPNYLSVSADGIVFGFPDLDQTSPKPYTFLVSATDKNGQVAYKSFSLRVANPTVTITTNRILPAGIVHSPYSYASLSAVGGVTPYSWKLSSGVLPDGLTLNSDGTFAGVILSGSGSPYTFSATVTDAASANAIGAFQLNVSGQSQLLYIDATGSTSVQVDTSVKRTYTAVGGVPPYLFTVAAGTLPAGTGLTPYGILSGAIATPNTYSFTIGVTDSAGTTATYDERITVSSGCEAPDAYEGQPYYYQVPASCYTNCTAGPSPAGITLTPGGCTLQGTPPPGSLTSIFPFQSSSFTFTSIPVSPAPYPSYLNMNIWGRIRPTYGSGFDVEQTYGVVGQPFAFCVSAQGGRVPWRDDSYAYIVIPGGTVPDGLQVGLNGCVTGTPKKAGSYRFRIDANDGFSLPGSFDMYVNITASPTTNTVITPGQTLPMATPGAPFRYQLAASASSTVKWQLASGSSLPQGLALSLDGVLSGTPTASQTTATTSPLTFNLVDQTGATQDSVTLSLDMTAPAPTPVVITTGSPLPRGALSKRYAITLGAAGGVAPYTWTLVTGTLPTGLSLAAGGAIAGTPQAAGAATFTLRATDALGTHQDQAYTLTINNSASWVIDTPAELVFGMLGYGYFEILHISDLTVSASWSWIAGDPLPSLGLTLGSDGSLTGTPSRQGPIRFRARVTAGTDTDEMDFTIYVISGGSLPPAILTNRVDLDLASPPVTQIALAAGGRPAYAWQSTVGGNSGLSVATGNGVATIQGMPAQTGTYEALLQLRDDAGATATGAVRIDAIDSTQQPAILSPTLIGVVHTGDDAHTFQKLQASASLGNNLTFTPLAASASPGYGLDSSGTVTGVAGDPGSFGILLGAANQQGGSASKHFQFAVLPPIMIPPILPIATAGTLFQFQLAAPPILGAVKWQFANADGSPGTAPAAWLQLDPDRGTLSGVPDQSGYYLFSIRATTAFTYGPGSPSPLFPLSLYVQPSGSGTALAIVTTALPRGNAGAAYNQTLAASGGVPPYTWTVPPGALPAGLTLSATGVLAGTPPARASTTFTVTVADTKSATATYILTLGIGPSCDVTQDGNITVADVQRVILETLGTAAATHDLNNDSKVNVADIQLVINATVGLGCTSN